jgi:hypothetical protein
LFFLAKSLFKKAKTQALKPLLPPEPPYEIAFDALNALKAEDLPGRGKIKEYYIRLSDIIRHYIEERFTIRAPEMTTDEFLFNLKDQPVLSGPHKNLLKEFLREADMVKFARYGPSSTEIDNSFSAAWRFVEETRPPVAEPVKI